MDPNLESKYDLIALTGSTGSIGRHLTQFKPLNSRLHWSTYDLVNSFIDIGAVTTLVHLSSPTDVKLIEGDYQLSKSLILDGSLNLMRALSEVNGKRFVYASSAHVYLQKNTFASYRENDLTGPTSTYGKLKLECENELIQLGFELGIEIVIARIFSVFASDMSPHFLSSKVIRGCQSGNFEIIQNADDTRDFSYPSVVASKFEKVATSNFTGVINFCSGQPKTVREKVLEVCPTWPGHKLKPGNSAHPFLVGNPDKYNRVFDQSYQ